MRINAGTRAFAAVLLLVLLSFVYAMADPVSEPGSSNPSTPAQLPSDSSISKPGEMSAEGGGNTQPADPFVPSETISADSAISFPVDI